MRGADGEVSDDDQRDAEYTRALGRRLAQVYPALTVFHSTALLARVLYDAIAAATGTRDVYRLLRATPQQLAVDLPTAVAGVERLRRRLREHAAWGAEHPHFIDQASAGKVDDAVRGLSSYHTRPIVERGGDTLHVKDVKLLYYYQNRLAHIPVEGAS